jgi:hypothetical protein
MRLNAPSQTLWIISLILAGLGILSHLVVIPNVSPYAFWLLAIGYIVLLIGTMTKGA